ncbi:MAG: GatB/YqeY domain-containing protein [Burkholderiaceae bacterium]
MSLKDRITQDMKIAMRAKDAPRLLTIRGLLAALKQREVDERIVLSDADVIAIVDRSIKQRKESISQFGAAGRTDLVDKESAELLVLEGYLPQRLDAAQIDAEVAAVVAALAAELGRAAGAADMGKVMAALKAKLAGQAEMALLSAAVKKALSQ